jgi:branched-subunit amino acid transport protein
MPEIAGHTVAIPAIPKNALAFVGLNMADAWLTTQLLTHGGVESFWWSAHYNSNIFVKGLLALLVAVVLIRLGKARLLKWLNIAMLFVVLSNGICFLGYFISWLYWKPR